VNENQGAESTLSFLLALLEMRAADRLSESRSSPIQADGTLQMNRRFAPPIATARGKGSAEPETLA
jgi:hypothetical protein